ncbi:uncharacterized protein LOC131631810 [Vicia villosa]|uniref:uncharacterized protein LOC131631810 n=1 Tax=Vicia villosa TaxID=3911 RepID=UPI00273B4FE8|nr:uncharacterized protein LOC131631810 [Vicia villosa]
MKVKCPFILRSMPSESRWKIIVRCEFHNHMLAKDLNGNAVLGPLKDYKIKFVNDMTKYNLAPKYIVAALKDKDPENLMSINEVYKAYNASKRCPLTEMKHLMNLIHEDKYMYQTRNRDSSNVSTDH